MLPSALLLLFAVQSAPAPVTQSPETSIPPLERVVTQVGTVGITLGDVRGEVNRLVPLTFFHTRMPEEKKLATYKKALGNLVESALIHQDALARKIPSTEKEIRAEFRVALTKVGKQYANISDAEFSTLLDTYRVQVVRRLLIDKNEARFEAELPEVSEEAVLKRFEMIKEELITPEEARFLHILCKVPPVVDKAEGIAIRAEIDALRQRLVDGENFEQLAKEYSDDIFASVGGDMGFIQTGAFSIRELNSSAFALKDGETSEVLISLYGFHILRRVETRAPRRLTLEEAQPDIRIGLAMEIRATARIAWLAEISASIGVEELITLDDDQLPATEGKDALPAE